MKKQNIGKIIAGGIGVCLFTLTGLLLRNRYKENDDKTRSKKKQEAAVNTNHSEAIRVLSFSLLVLNRDDNGLKPMVSTSRKIGRIKNFWMDSPRSEHESLYGSYFNVYALPDHCVLELPEMRGTVYNFNYCEVYNRGDVRALCNWQLKISRVEIEGDKKRSFHLDLSVHIEDFCSDCDEDPFTVLVNISEDKDSYSECLGIYRASDGCEHTDHVLVNLAKIREEQAQQASESRGKSTSAYDLAITAGLRLSVKKIGKEDKIIVEPILQLQRPQARL